MQRVSLVLSKKVKRALEKEAQESGKSQSEIVRDSLEKVLLHKRESQSAVLLLQDMAKSSRRPKAQKDINSTNYKEKLYGNHS